MAYEFSFDRRVEYDAAADGIDLPLVLSSDKRRIQLLAKLDTGATHCVFARSIGEVLGFEIEQGERRIFATAIGRFTAYGHWLSITCEGLSTDVLAFFAADPEFQRNVLGRRGWLEQMRLAIIDYDRVLYFSPYDS